MYSYGPVHIVRPLTIPIAHLFKIREHVRFTQMSKTQQFYTLPQVPSWSILLRSMNIYYVLNNLKYNVTMSVLGISHHAREKAKHAISFGLYFFNSSHIWVGE